MSKQNEELRKELENTNTFNANVYLGQDINQHCLLFDKAVDEILEFLDHHISKAAIEELEIVRNLKGETVDEWAFNSHPYLLDRIAELKAKEEAL